MSRIGDFARRVADGVLSDLGPSTPVPGDHVHPDRDQADTARRPPYGATGTINYKGYLQPSEYNPDLQRFQAIDVYERMRRSDPSVRETLWHMFGPIVNAEWTIEPPDDPTPEEREQAEMVRAALFEWLEQPWTEVLEHALTYLTFGHSVFEPVFQVVTRALTVREPVGEGDDTAGVDEDVTDRSVTASLTPSGTKNVVEIPVPLPPDTATNVLPERQFTTWRRFSPRLPKTLWQWHVDEFGELVSVTQTVWINLPDGSQGYKVVDIPAENLMVFTHEKWGDEWTGVSLLRSAYKPWVMKEMIEKIAGIAYERHGVGYLLGYIPREKEDDQDLQDRVKQMLMEMRADAVAVMPGPKQMSGATGPQGYLVEILSPTGGIPDFDPILTYWRGEIAGAMLARFKELGHAATGARATADVQSAVWYNALHACARYIESVFNVAIRRMLDLNYTGVKRYPKLKAAGIEARNLLEFAQAVALLVDAEILAPDLPTRQWARATIDAPSEDLQETRARAIYEAQAQKAQAQQEQANSEALVNAKASAAARGVETSSSENGGRPRVSNAEAVADALNDIAAELVDARKKGDRQEIADLLRAQADGLVAAIQAMPAPKIEIEPKYVAETHQHDHEHQHEGPDEATLRRLIAETFEHAQPEKMPSIARTEIRRDSQGRIARIRAFDADGNLIRSRKVTAHDADGVPASLQDEE